MPLNEYESLKLSTKKKTVEKNSSSRCIINLSVEKFAPNKINEYKKHVKQEGGRDKKTDSK